MHQRLAFSHAYNDPSHVRCCAEFATRIKNGDDVVDSHSIVSPGADAHSSLDSAAPAYVNTFPWQSEHSARLRPLNTLAASACDEHVR